MSPEQAEGRPLDRRSDVFSFGSVFYEMLTGQRAFRGDSRVATLSAILKEDPKPAGQIQSGLPVEVERVVTRCLRKNPERRFHHAEDLRVALEDIREESESGKLAAPAAVPTRRRRWIWLLATGALTAAAIFAVLYFRARPPAAAPAIVVTPLTSFDGSEGGPTFSPDGNQVAFVWDGEQKDNYDIYVRLVDSTSLLRLTKDPSQDFSPAWSPDGRSIAFLRGTDWDATLILISAIGGPERRLGAVRGRHAFLSLLQATCLAWMPDGKHLVVSMGPAQEQPRSLYLVSIDTNERSQLTRPEASSVGDFHPAVSPDGRQVAFARVRGYGLSEIFCLHLTSDLHPAGDVRQLTTATSIGAGAWNPAWTRDGTEIMYAAGSGEATLWRVPVDGSGQPQRLPVSEAGFSPAIAPQGNRLAYARMMGDRNLYRLPLSAPGVASGPPARFAASTRTEMSPEYSPDGRTIAFSSGRSGNSDIWTCNYEGRDCVQVSRTGFYSGTPRFSPDGKRIAFDMRGQKSWDVYVMDIEGGQPLLLSQSPADDYIPGWSADGEWIHFSSTRTGRSEIWKVPARGGKEVQVTTGYGHSSTLSPDGKFLYYTKAGGLWRMPFAGGLEERVLAKVFIRAYTLGVGGIYFAPPSARAEFEIHYYSFADRTVRKVAVCDSLLGVPLALAPDGKSLMYTQQDNTGSDLVLVENFR